MNTEPDPTGGGNRQTVPCGVDGCDQAAASTLTHTDGGREHLCEDHIAEFYITGDDGTLRDRLIADSRNRICETGGCQQLADQTLVDTGGNLSYRCGGCVDLLEHYTAAREEARQQTEQAEQEPEQAGQAGQGEQGEQGGQASQRGEQTQQQARRAGATEQTADAAPSSRPARPATRPVRQPGAGRIVAVTVAAVAVWAGLAAGAIATAGDGISLPVAALAIAVFGLGLGLSARSCHMAGTSAGIAVVACLSATGGMLLLGSTDPVWLARLADTGLGVTAGLAVIAVDDRARHHRQNRGDRR